MHAEKAVKKVSRDLRMYARRVAEMKYAVDTSMSYTTAREEVLKEKLQIAKNLLAKGMSVEFVQETTGLSLEEIKEL